VAALWPVFGLLVLTLEWVVLRRIAPRLAGRSVAARALIGGLAGFGMSAALALVGLFIPVIVAPLQLSAEPLDIVQAVAATLYLTGFFFALVAALFGAVLLAVERYRVPPVADAQD
jgi:hypothetical protein